MTDSRSPETNRVYRYTRFTYTDVADGGSRRTRQLETMLRAGGFDVQDLGRTKVRRPPLVRSFLEGVRAWRQLGFRCRRLLTTAPAGNWRFLKECSLAWQGATEELGGLPPGSRILWENTWNPLVAFAAARLGHHVVAAPHNLEMLVASQHSAFYACGRVPPFQAEIRALARASRVFTISREEEWLLSLFGVAATYLPYIPVGEVRECLLDVRRHRPALTGGPFLVFGTARNPPTRQGMERLAALLAQLDLPADIRFVVAGHGTGELAQSFPAPRFSVRGSLGEAELHDLLASARALIVHQDQGTGALTRIPEMLTAGVPVIASAIAARSAYDLAGVYTYCDRLGLGDLLRRDLAMPPAPSMPAGVEELFRQAWA